MNGIGNPQVSWAVPVPIPVCTLTCDPAGFPDKTSHGSSKTVKYWVSGWLPVGLENLKPSSKHVSQEMPQCRLSEMFRNVVLGLCLSVNKQFQILIMRRGMTPPFSSKSQSQTFFRCLTTFYGSLTRSTLSRDINPIYNTHILPCNHYYQYMKVCTFQGGYNTWSSWAFWGWRLQEVKFRMLHVVDKQRPFPDLLLFVAAALDQPLV